jgi:hypothetical protein
MRALSGSPSGGEFELLRGLYLAGGHDGAYTPPYVVKRRFPKRTTVAEITALLAANVGANVQSDGSGNYRLSAAGVARSRANKPRRWIVVT